ncbi:MAG: orotidine-5'-phosphate decarboxylase [Flavobacteriia bacterium]|nr:orotidine-5'-phosphate decarboxylase [Flavobacteriia bacterium]
MNKKQLVEQIIKKKSFLCVGLDTDIEKIPSHLLTYEDPIFEFNKQIIDATSPFCIAYKPNIAFYESLGIQGWMSLKKTIEYIPKNCFTIADAKRGDIGNTSKYYAKTFFEWLSFDAITLSPYMGEDSISPYLNWKGKWSIVLALTSNAGAMDFQFIMDENQKPLYQRVIEKTQQWGTEENLMFVIGATRSEEIAEARKRAKNHFFLIPGYGAQGGSLQDVCSYALNEEVGILVNSSRGIIYASSQKDFALRAGEEAQKIQKEMEQILFDKGFVNHLF